MRTMNYPRSIFRPNKEVGCKKKQFSLNKEKYKITVTGISGE